MTLIANATTADWADVMAQLARLMHARNSHPSRTVILVPYAQLMQQARLAWARHNADQQSFFMPRFETTLNWANTLPRAELLADDIQMNGAIDTLTAASLLKRAGLTDRQHELTGRLVDAAVSLARVAMAQVPASRLAWGAQMANEIGVSMESPALILELAVARIALAWAAASSYPTDVLFSAQTMQFDLIVVIEGFQSDPLTETLKAHFGPRTASLVLTTPPPQNGTSLHAAPDLEAEAHLAAACVLAHLAAGRSPVAFVAQDRLLTRRVRAMLAGQGVSMRDETGWTLSTTRAAATVMGLLRAMAWDATSDTVLDWLKNAPAFETSAVAGCEIVLRKLGISHWSALPAQPPKLLAVAVPVALCRDAFQRSRPIADWLNGLINALQQAGQWTPLVADAAGAAVVSALHMEDASALPGNPRMSLSEFTQWANQALEAASFAPVHPAHAHVVILPLSQLLGRPLGAVVMPGCDEIRLAVSPEPAGAWTAAQRSLLCLPSRAELTRNQRAAWQYALSMPHLDVLWRQSEGGESLMPSGFIQVLLLQQKLQQKITLQPTPTVHDPRAQRTVVVEPIAAPHASGQALPVLRLSASAYEDLRACPYRFFALRQLGLQEADELQTELSKRDFGSWLHLLLNIFQNALKNSSNDAVAHTNQARAAMLNIAADEATQTLALGAEEFLPFAAIWPRVRDGYLDWLTKHEASGAIYLEGEVWKSMPLGRIELIGKIDRIDQLPDGSRVVMDYKTEATGVTQGRLKAAGEDTQLPFYAALLHDDTLTAAYVNLGEKGLTKTHTQPQIVQLRDDLINGILTDLQQISEGVLLSALGEGTACDHCAARGLCRKDFWAGST